MSALQAGGGNSVRRLIAFHHDDGDVVGRPARKRQLEEAVASRLGIGCSQPVGDLVVTDMRDQPVAA